MKANWSFFLPPIFEDERRTNQARLLNVIIWALIVVPIPYFFLISFIEPAQTQRALIQSIAGEIANFLILFILKRGRVALASWLQVTAFWIFFTLTASTSTGVHSAAYLLGYGLVISIAGILLGGKGAILATVFSLLAGVYMTLTELLGYIPRGYIDSTLATWIISAIFFPVGATLQYIASRQIRHAFKRASDSEERYRLISSVTTDYTFASVVDEQGNTKVDWVAGAFEKMTGYTFGEYVASGGWLAHVIPDDLEKDARDMRTLLHNQDVKSDIRTFAKNGEIRWERIYAHPVWEHKKNRLVGIVGAVQDVTEQKQAEEALRASEAIYRQAIEVAGAVPYHQTYPENGGITYDFIGEGIRQITGFGPEQFTESLWDDLTQERILLEDLSVFSMDEAIHKVRSGEYPIWKCEHRIQARDGETHWVFEAAVELRDGHGVSHGSVGMFQDITERKKADLDRENLFAQMEAKNAELERFTYSVSHDLKSPLVTISGFLGYIEKDIASGNREKVKHNVTRIQVAIEKMQALLNDLLELSRVGRLMNPPETVDMNETVSETLELLSAQIDMGKIKVKVQDGLPQVCGDRLRLREVTQNLLENAIKFMGQQAFPQIEIGTQGTLNGLPVLFVRDNGIGIEPAYQEKVFGLFNKLDTETEGTGIGLTLTKRIVEFHGGEIWLESQGAQRGTTFYFTLPTKDETG